MNNRRQMYYQRYSGMRNTPNTESANVSAQDATVTSNSCDCNNHGERPTPYMRGGAMQQNSRCNNCIRVNDMPGFALAMAYVPWQTFQHLYDEHEAFRNGTIFKELDLDFAGRRCN